MLYKFISTKAGKKETENSDLQSNNITLYMYETHVK